MTGAMKPRKWPNVLHSEEGRERQYKIKWSNHGICAKKLMRIQSFLGILRVRLFQVEGRVRAYNRFVEEKKGLVGIYLKDVKRAQIPPI